MRWSVAIACAVMWTGCRSAPAPIAAPHATPEREPPTRVEVLPDGPISWVGVEPDGWSDLTFGGARVQALDDEVRVADDLFALRITLAVQVAHGWVFCAEDGACAASETFLGPLRRVGEFPGMRVGSAETLSIDARGRAAVIDAQAVAWTSDGGTFRKVTYLPAVALRAILFTDARQGAAIIDGGGLMVTADGGETWAMARSLDWRSAGEPPYDSSRTALCVTEGRLDDHREGFASVYRDHLLTPRSESRFDVERRRLPFDFQTTLLAMVRRRPSWIDAFDARPVSPHSVSMEGDAPPVEVDLRDGRVLGLSSREAHRDEAFDFSRFGAPPESDATPARDLRDESSGPPRTRAARSHGRALGRTLLTLLPEGIGSCVNGDEVSPHPLITTLSSTGHFSEIGLNPSGTFSGVALHAVPPRFIVGRIDGTAAQHPLPPDARHVVFADPSRGIAWGERPEILRTLDGGRTWHVLPTGLDDASIARFWRGEPNRYPGQCDTERCVVGRRFFVTGWSPRVEHPRAPLAARDREPGGAAEGGWRLDARIPRLRCASSGPATALTPPPTPPAPRGNRWSAPISQWTNTGRVTVYAAERGGASLPHAVTWSGLDARGAFRGATRVLSVRSEMCFFPSTAWGAEPRRGVVHLISSCFPPTNAVTAFDGEARVEEQNDLPWTVSVGEPVRPLFEGWGATRGTAWYPDGDGVIQLDLRAEHRGDDGAPPLTRVSLLHEFSGGCDINRSLDDCVAFARRGDEVGLAAVRVLPSRRVVLFPSRNDSRALPVRLPWVDEGPIHVCTAAAAPNTPQIVVSNVDVQHSATEIGAPVASTVTLDLEPGQVCLRALTLRSNQALVSVTARGDGALEGARLSERALTPTRCAP
ncbi:MAG: hypothetical protein R3A52_18970 [Polyangiales bacterium]